MKTIRVAVASAALAVGAAACGGAAAAPSATNTTTVAPTTAAAATTSTTAIPTTSSSAPTTKELAVKFLALVAPYNAEVIVLNAKYPNGATDTSQFEPLIGPMTTFDNGILRIGLTGQAAIDARTMVTADSAVVADIDSSDGTDITRDFAATDAADNALRADFGLPAVTQ